MVSTILKDIFILIKSELFLRYSLALFITEHSAEGQEICTQIND